MDYRGVLLVAIVSGAGLLGVVSCSGPDPQQVTFGEPRGAAPVGTGSSGQPGDGGSTSSSGGDGGGGDGGSSGTPADPVFGTSTFAAGNPGRGAPAKAANAAHEGDASGKDCLTCHAGEWAFAGTLYTDAAGTARVVGAEIRVTGPDGKEYAKTFSDADGNFWIDSPGQAIPVGSRVGVRSADKKKNMVGVVGAGQAGCSQGGTCHGGTQGKVYLN